MIINNIKNLIIKQGYKILALDISKNYIGIALSDKLNLLSFPYKTYKRTKLFKDLEEINKIILQEKVNIVIIGLPLERDGSEKSKAQSIRTFALNLQKKVAHIDIFLQDERYSTHFIERNNVNNKKKTQVDEQAAAWFLQILLDRLKNLL